MSGSPKLRILLVEDNKVNQTLAAIVLEQGGHRVNVADNGRLGLEAWRGDRFDLILMDMMMPEMDGLEATRRIRAEEAERGAGRIPIVAVTASVMPGDRERCLRAGMDGFVGKPFTPEVLLREIDRVLGRVVPAGGDSDRSANMATPVFDRDDALLRIGGDEELLGTLIDMFVDDTPRYLAELDAALDTADWPRLARGAHDLKGVLATFSARRAEALARELEQAGKAGRGVAAAELISPLRRELEMFLCEVAR